MTSSKILKQSTHRNIQFSILIENFHSFVTSKAEYESVSIDFNNTKWFIKIELYKCGQTSNNDIHVTPSSTERLETLVVFVCGRRSDQKEYSFAVDTILKFKQPIAAKEIQFSQKFEFTSTKNYLAWGYRSFAKIDVILLYHFLSNFCLTVNFRIFLTSARAIWLIIHSSFSLTYQFLSVNEFLLIIFRRIKFSIGRNKSI